MTGLEPHQQKLLGSTDNNGKRISLFSKVAGPDGAYPSYPVVSVSYFPNGVRGTGRRGDPSPPSSVTVRGAEPLLLHYAFMLSHPNYPGNSNLPVLNTTRKNKISVCSNRKDFERRRLFTFSACRYVTYCRRTNRYGHDTSIAA
jgi:hypothetical protein